MSLHGWPAQAQSPESLYADRENLVSARQAVALLTADVARDGSAFEPSWQLARICYWMGAHAPEAELRAFLERGVVAAQSAARPAGSSLIAANRRLSSSISRSRVLSGSAASPAF